MSAPRTSFRSHYTDRARLKKAAQQLSTTPSELCRTALKELLDGLERRQLISSPRP